MMKALKTPSHSPHSMSFPKSLLAIPSDPPFFGGLPSGKLTVRVFENGHLVR